MATINDRGRRTGWPSLLADNPSYRSYFTARTLSVAGSQLTYAATPLVCLTAYHSPVAAGIAGTCGYGGSIAFGLLGTPLADRFSRKAIMLGADTLRCLTMSLVGLSLTLWTRPPVAVLFVGVTLVAAASSAFNSAAAAILPDLVGKADFTSASAANQARDFGLALVGPILGGALAVADPALPFWLDGVSYLASFACLLAVVVNIPARPAIEQRYLASIRAGLAALRNDQVGFGLIMTTAILNVLLSVLVYGSLAQAVADGHSHQAGIVLGTQAVGGLIGTIFVRRIYLRLHPPSLFAAHVSLWIVGALLVATTNNLVVATVALACMWLTVPAFRTLVSGHLVQRHPEQFRGRVFGLFDLISSVSASIGPLAAGIAFARSATSILDVVVVLLSALVAFIAVARPLRAHDAILVRQ